MASPIVKRYFLAVNRYKWLLPMGLALGVTGASLVVSQPDPPPTYTVEATLVANRPTTAFSATGTEVRQPIETFTADSLVTEAMLNGVAQKVGLNSQKILKNLKVTLAAGESTKDKKAAPSGGNNQVQLVYRDVNENRAKQVIQSLAEQIVQQSQANNSARLKAIIESLNQRIPQAKAELNAAEQQLELYDRTEGPALIAAQNGSLSGAISQSDTQQRVLGLELERINAEVASLQSKLGLDPNQAYVSSALSADPIIANLRAQIYQIESQLAIAGKDLTPAHPRMVELTQQKTALDEQLQQRAREVMGGDGVAAPFQANVRQDSSLDPKRQEMANQLVALTTQREGIVRQLQLLSRSRQDLRLQLQNLPNKQLARTRLEDQFKLKKALHDQMQAKLIDAKTAEAETVSSLSVAQLSTIPIEPKPPKNAPLMILVGGVVGLILGAGVIFLLDMMEGTVYTPEDLRDTLRQQDVPLLGMVPWIPSWENSNGSPLLLKADSPYSDAYERLRSTLRLAEGTLPKMLLISSPIAQEGKTTVAYNLAIAAARSGKRTLLIEADLRSTSRSQELGISLPTDRLREPLRYYSHISDCIQLVPEVENLYIIPGVGVQSQAASILESNEIHRLLEDAQGRFDFVVLDTPPLSQCNDALLLEPYTDGLILVTRPGITQQSLLTEAIEQLNESENLTLLGAVVNGVEVDVLRPVETSTAYQPPLAIAHDSAAVSTSQVEV
ncbi:GumC family protein [Alkalinema pantanalense CENA528]|uniref:GumC family protein n=1 Tax=Alkalinema pantanalense TaxID=1620705 RepID=UPI003D6F0544